MSEGPFKPLANISVYIMNSSCLLSLPYLLPTACLPHYYYHASTTYPPTYLLPGTLIWRVLAYRTVDIPLIYHVCRACRHRALATVVVLLTAAWYRQHACMPAPATLCRTAAAYLRILCPSRTAVRQHTHLHVPAMCTCHTATYCRIRLPPPFLYRHRLPSSHPLYRDRYYLSLPHSSMDVFYNVAACHVACSRLQQHSAVFPVPYTACYRTALRIRRHSCKQHI